MYLKTIITRNLQNHREVEINLPSTGFVVFTGPNSNGKSVIVRTTKLLVSKGLQKPRNRAALVNRDVASGEIVYIRDDGTQLTAHIAREASLTYVTLAEPNKEPITRYLADKSYLDLVYRFGWHYDDTYGISLNIAEAEEAILFYKTPYKANCNIIRTATSDSAADKVAESFDETLKEARQFRESYIQQVTATHTALSSLTVEPIEPLQEKLEKLNWCLRNLEHVKFPKIPEIVPVPRIHYVNVQYPRIPDIKYPRIVDIEVSIPDITPVAEDLKALREQKCPTCGRRFSDDV